MNQRSNATDSSRIPNDWRIMHLGEIADVVGGSTPSRSEPSFWGGLIPWVVPSEVSQLNGRYLHHTTEMITETGAKAAGLKTLPAGSVLLTTRATIGTTAICSAPTTTNQGFQSLVPHNGTDSLWLFYRVRALTHELTRRAAGSTFREVSRQSVRGVPVPFPPLAEQQAIAEVLDAIDCAIESTDAVIAATERLREALLHELLTNGFPGWHTEWQEHPKSGTLPADWKVFRLGDVAEVVMGQSPPGATVLDWTDGVKMSSGLPFIQGTAEFGATTPHPQEWCTKPPRSARPGDHLISVRAPVGETNRTDQALGIGRGLAAIRFDSRSRTYGWHALNKQKEHLHRIAQGSTFLAIGRTELRSLPIPLPPLAEQQAIAEVLDGVDSAMEQTGREKATLAAFKESISDALLTGRVRVPMSR